MLAYFRLPKTISLYELLRRTAVDTLEDGCPGMAAQLAFYFLLGVFPALMLVIALVARLPIDPALAAVLDRLAAFTPGDVLAVLRAQLDRMLDGPPAGLLTLAIAGAIWSSSSAMTAIIYTLNRAYDLEEWRPWWHTRLLAIGLTLGLAVFTVLAFALVVGGADLARWLATQLGYGDLFSQFWRVVQWPLAFFLVVLAIDLVYHFGPNAETKWTWLSAGSVLATTLWLAASVGFKLYVRNFGDFGAVYGSIGAVIVLLLWFYLSGLAILVGAELNAEIDKGLPSRDTAPQTPQRRRKIGPAAEDAADPAERSQAAR
jgi:membrane protein